MYPINEQESTHVACYLDSWCWESKLQGHISLCVYVLWAAMIWKSDLLNKVSLISE